MIQNENRLLQLATKNQREKIKELSEEINGTKEYKERTGKGT